MSSFDRPNWDEYFMLQAELAKLRSNCMTRQVGAVIVRNQGSEGAILYTTFVPCLECTKMAITIGIRKFVCLDSYPETDFDLLNEAGVEIMHLDKKNIARWVKVLVSKYEKSV
jgi:dCMP deaminase